MEIIDLSPEYESLFFLCLEDWSDEIREAGIHKECWYRRMKEQGLRVKLARNDEGRVGGMIQVVPVEHSPAEGKDLDFILCVWVHGHKKGRGNFQKKGMGKALLQAAEGDAKARGAKGIAAWGVSLPFWMKVSWFKKRGYVQVDKNGLAVLLWKPFSDEAEPPRWVKEKKKPGTNEGKVTVSAFLNGWCPAQNLVFERAKRVASELGEKVQFDPVFTQERDVFLEWGILDGLYIDSKRVRTGPPPSYKKLRKKVAAKVRRLR